MNFPDGISRLLLLFSLLLPWLAVTINGTVVTSPAFRRGIERLTPAVQLALALAMLGCLGRDWFDGVKFPNIAVQCRFPFFAGHEVFLSQASWSVDPINGGGLALLPLLAMTARAFAPDSPSSNPSQLPLLGGATWTLCAGDPATLLIGSLTGTVFLCSRLLRLRDHEIRRTTRTFLTAEVCGWTLILAAVAMLVGIAAIVRSAPHGLPTQTTTTFATLGRLLTGSTSQHPAALLLWEQYRDLPMLTFGLGAAILAGIFPFHGRLVPILRSATTAERLWLICWSRISLLTVLRMAILLLPGFLDELHLLSVVFLILGGVAISLLMVRDSLNPGRPVLLFAWTAQQTALAAFLLPSSQWPVLASLLQAHFALAALVVLALPMTTGQILTGDPHSGSEPFGSGVSVPTVSAMGAVGALLGLGLFTSRLGVRWIQTAEIGLWTVPLLIGFCVAPMLVLAAVLKGIGALDIASPGRRGFWIGLWTVLSIAGACVPPLVSGLIESP